MPEHDALEFATQELLDDGGRRGIGKMAVPRLDPLLHRPGPMRIVLQQLLVVVRLDHERVHFPQPLDHHLRRVTEIGDESERAFARVKRVADRVNRVMRDGERLDVDIADGKIGAGPEEPPVPVLA